MHAKHDAVSTPELQDYEERKQGTVGIQDLRSLKTVKTSSKSGSEDTLDLALPKKMNMYRSPRDAGEMPMLLESCHLHH